MKILKKYYKWIILLIILIIFFVLGLLVYLNIFKETASNRLENIEKYVITKKEISNVKEKYNEIEEIDKISIETNNKIIKIFITLKEDVKFDDIKEISNEAIKEIKDKNLGYYDVEIFVDCKEESEVYPKIGYKHKSNSEFSWNR